MDLDEKNTHWLAIIIALTLGVALIFLIVKKISE